MHRRTAAASSDDSSDEDTARVILPLSTSATSSPPPHAMVEKNHGAVPLLHRVAHDLATPVPVHRAPSASTAIYHLPADDTGYKTIEDPDPNEEQILLLLKEERISRYLPPRCRQRRVIQVRSFMGHPALHFEWVDGASLTEWLESEEGREATLVERLNVAVAIAQTLCEFHEGDVAHQRISPENIIMDTSREPQNDGERVASLINLSFAEIVTELEAGDATMAVENDLRDLGVVFHALFCGESSGHSDKEDVVVDDAGDPRPGLQPVGGWSSR